MSEVIVRFAPSPTGFLHIGGARTALYNIMFAKSRGGHCILRIDDTDLERSEARYEREIRESLEWLGLVFNEFYRQSERKDIYEKYMQLLREKGLLYEQSGEKGTALVFRTEKKSLSFRDLIRGDISQAAEEASDIVVRKSDGTPTYLFASCADDIEMKVSHIIRGEDHISNTFKQLLLFEALSPGKFPQFAHLPLILAEDGSRLSKRHGATSVLEFRNMGYLPEALRNALILLGWSPGDDAEIIDFGKACETFDLGKVSKRGARFSYEKAEWINGKYIKFFPPEEIIEKCLLLKMDKIAKYKAQDPEKLIRAVRLTKERPRLLKDFEAALHFFFDAEIVIPEELRTKFLTPEESLVPLFHKVKTCLIAITDFKAPAIESCLREMAHREGVKAKDILIPLRVILSGKDVTPGIFDCMEVMGKDLCFKRLIDYLNAARR